MTAHDDGNGRSLRIAVFCENRNSVHLANRIMQATSRDRVQLFTADPVGVVAEWTKQGALDVGLGDDVVRNICPGPAMGADWTDDVEDASRAWLAAEQIDRLVLFNDQARRGSRVARSAQGLCPVILVQDGHLDFIYRNARPAHRDQNWHYGAGPVSDICLWGASTEKFITNRGPEPTGRTHVVGALGISEDPAFIGATEMTAPHRRRNSGPIRVLVADQPLGDQRKVPCDTHQEILASAARTIERFGTFTVKPHPSSSRRHLEWLESSFPGRVAEPTRGFEQGTLQKYDVVVTFFSTIYTDTLLAGVPLIFLNHPEVDVAFPRVKHPLLRAVAGVSGLAEALQAYGRSGVFSGDRHGAAITSMIRTNDHVVDDILSVIRTATSREFEPAAADHSHVETPEASQYTPAITRMVAQIPFPPASLTVVSDDLTFSTGVAIPIRTAIETLDPEAMAAVEYVDTRGFLRTSDLVERLARAQTVLVNSLAPFWRSRVFSEAIEEVIARGANVFVYAHETDWVFKQESSRVPDRHGILLSVLPHVTVLCVSAHQAQLMQSLGAGATHVVLNTTPGVTSGVFQHKPLDTTSVRILMAGTVQERKGAQLFSDTADLCASLGLPYSFAWAGRLTERFTEAPNLSENVDWLGQVDRVRLGRLMDECDVFLLSSFDDPMPLVALEAATHGMRIVTYAGAGSAEIFAGLPGVAVFDTYDTTGVLEAVGRVLASEVSVDAFGEVIADFQVAAFRRRLALAIALDAHEPVSPQRVAGEPAPGARGGAISARDAVLQAARGPAPSDLKRLFAAGRASGRADELAAVVLAAASATQKRSARYWLTVSRACFDLPLRYRAIGRLTALRALEANPRSRRARAFAIAHLLPGAASVRAVRAIGGGPALSRGIATLRHLRRGLRR